MLGTEGRGGRYRHPDLTVADMEAQRGGQNVPAPDTPAVQGRLPGTGGVSARGGKYNHQ
ncbi:hypothetical protein [Methanoculleus chikugoensis]|uniref:hypothetical protein n=1 Tax=Methanoculleus chikugoensis TaxID=118126 RepID=UPI000AD805CE|nr:hypothetical protein [Methanoculleus chikugoensis]